MEASKEWDECPDSTGSSLELTIVGCAHTEWATRTAGGGCSSAWLYKEKNTMNQKDSVSLQKCFVVDSPEMLGGGEGQRWREEEVGNLFLIPSSIWAILEHIRQPCGNTWRSISCLRVTHLNGEMTWTHKIAFIPLPLLRFFRATTCSKFGYFTWRFSTNSHTFLRCLSAVYVTITAAWSGSVVSSEEMVAVSATTVSHTQSVPKPPVASLRRCFHVCKHTDWHLCTKIILTCDSLLYILAALNYEIGWCLFIVF